MFNLLRKAVLTGTTLCIIGAGAASAAVVSAVVTASSPVAVTGVVGIPPGGIVGDNKVNTNTLYAFDEKQNILLSSPLAINVVAGSIAPGTRIDSHYVVFDPRGRVTVEATITFKTAILGLITKSGTLLASNFLGAPGVTYLNDKLTGLEGSEDTISFSGDFTSLTWTASNPGDHIRVITAAAPIPLPAGGLLLIGALGGLAALRRRKTA